MRKSKNRYFYHIFPWGRPWGNHANVVWMEREFDAYKLSCCMCPSKYNCFWDTARYFWKKIFILSYPLAFDAPVRGVPVGISAPLWFGKTRMVWLPDGEKISKICLFFLTWSTNVTDRQADTWWQQRPRLCIASRGKNVERAHAKWSKSKGNWLGKLVASASIVIIQRRI